METIELIPDAQLGEFIEKIYVNYSDSFDYQGIAEPFLRPELFFSFGEHFQIGQSSFNPNTPNPIAIIGNRSISVPVRASGNHLTAGVIFKPWGVYSAFGITGKQTLNQLLKITNHFEVKKLAGIAALKNFAPEAMIEILEFNAKGVIRNAKIKDSFQKSYAIVDNLSIEQANLEEVAFKVGLSKKTVIQLFNEHLGISPMKYIHIKTIIESLRYLKSVERLNLTRLALDLGFYDQSHFIRFFKLYMGMSPGEYIRYHKKVNSVQF